MTRVHLIDPLRPRCFDREQWAMWREAAMNRLLYERVHHCTDCTPEHQAAMTARALCDNPLGEATRDKDGFIQITPPQKETP